jgi:hypothetical protein
MLELNVSPREIKRDGYRIRLDPSRQVLRLSVPEQEVRALGRDGRIHLREETIYPTLTDVPELVTSFVPAGVFIQKAKVFDDGLLAAVEGALQKGAARFPAKGTLLSALARILSGRAEAREAYVLLLAACQLGGVTVDVPSDLMPRVNATVTDFLGNELESKPLGFYTWSPELEEIFRQDRLLQGELPKGAAQSLVDALRGDAGLREAYEGYLSLVSRLANPFADPDLRRFVAGPDPGLPGEGNRLRFFPRSVSHEGELAKRLFGDRSIPDGFSLMDEMIRRIRAGTLELEPTKESGWYDYQTWSHEPLVSPETMPEASRLSLDDSYRKELLALFKGAQALARETHVKDLELFDLGMAMVPEGHRAVIEVAPDLTVEPLATLYHRRAASYRFVRGVLEDAFGPAGLRQMRRLTPDGPSARDMATELADTETLFRGAYASVVAQIGLPLDPSVGSTADIQQFSAWAGGLRTDADLGRDARMMVPIFYDRQRNMTKVWVFLGWAARSVYVSFETPPAAQVFDIARRPVSLGEAFEIDFVPETHTLLSPVTAEVYVTQLLSRAEFRAHCDRLKTRSGILSGLR